VINSNDIDGFFVLFDEVKGFLLLFEIFSRFFVKEIIKDFWGFLLDFWLWDF
jgi:hypothetical protein